MQNQRWVKMQSQRLLWLQNQGPLQHNRWNSLWLRPGLKQTTIFYKLTQTGGREPRGQEGGKMNPVSLLETAFLEVIIFICLLRWFNDFFSTNVMNYLDWFWNIESPSHSWNKPWLDAWFYLLIFYLGFCIYIYSQVKSPPPPILWHQLGVQQFNSILTLMNWRLHQTPQGKGLVPQGRPYFRCQSQVLGLLILLKNWL